MLKHIDELTAHIKELDDDIDRHMKDDEKIAVAQIQEITGIGNTSAEAIFSVIGTDIHLGVRGSYTLFILSKSEGFTVRMMDQRPPLVPRLTSGVIRNHTAAGNLSFSRRDGFQYSQVSCPSARRVPASPAAQKLQIAELSGERQQFEYLHPAAYIIPDAENKSSGDFPNHSPREDGSPAAAPVRLPSPERC